MTASDSVYVCASSPYGLRESGWRYWLAYLLAMFAWRLIRIVQKGGGK